MPSPFPGMDPYIEARGLWGDFPNRLLFGIKRTLEGVLPEGYVARTGERSYMILSEETGKVPSPSSESEPVFLRAFVREDFVERFIDIYELEPERRLVTSIEVLSPTNKRRNTPGWEEYLRKRQALLLGEANLVEIDLLRGGTRMPMLDPWPTSPYTILVARREQSPRCRVWPAYFDRPLPAVPVPLSKPHPDIAVALQPLVEEIYERSRYRGDIDYTHPLSPPLTPEQVAWLQQRLQEETAPAKQRPARQPRKPRR